MKVHLKDSFSFEVGASYFSKLCWERTHGHVFGTNKNISIEDVAGKWGKIGDFTDAERPATIKDTFGVINAAVAHKSLGGISLLISTSPVAPA